MTLSNWLTCFFLLAAAGCVQQERGRDLNLNFERANDQNAEPFLWDTYARGHIVQIDRSEKYEGEASVSVTSDPDKSKVDSVALIIKRVETAFKGKVATLSGYLKLEDIEGIVGLSIGANGVSGRQLAVVDMHADSIRGTRQWEEYSVSLKIPDSTSSFDIALYQIGNGRLWADQLKFLIDGKDISNEEPAKVSVEAERFASKFGKVDGSLVNSRKPVVTIPPSECGFHPFYKKFINASGIAIIGSDQVDDEAFYQAEKVVNMMLKDIPEVKRKMIENNARIAIIGKDEKMTDLPEYSEWDESINNRARGTGGWIDFPLTSCGEENVLCLAVDRYQGEDILIHEFAHAIHMLGISYLDEHFNEKLEDVYRKAIGDGLWKNTYAISSSGEYFAEGVQSYFDVNRDVKMTDGIHNTVDTHSELKKYDPRLYELIASYFVHKHENVSCHFKKKVSKG